MTKAPFAPSIACIVEGHGEVDAVPGLIKRIGKSLNPPIYPEIPPPIRKPRSSLIKAKGVLENTVELAARLTGGGGGIFILIDADDDCPVELGALLLGRAKAQRSSSPVSVVVANREYEAWFIAAAHSLRGKQGLRDDLEVPANPESIRGAKAWLEKNMGGKVYTETTDQILLTKDFDLHAALSTRSFQKCYSDLERMLIQLRDRSRSRPI